MKTMLTDAARPGGGAAGGRRRALAAQDTPEQVVQRYFDTFRAGDYAGNAALMHPEALDELKKTMTRPGGPRRRAEDDRSSARCSASPPWRSSTG